MSQAQPVNRAGLGSDVGFPASTLDRYLAAFEEVFLLKLLPAWMSSATPRATAQPKLLFVDPGLGAHLAGVSARTFDRDAFPVRSVLEGFVLDTKHLIHLRDRMGDRFTAGVVVYGGTRAVSLGDRLLALPLNGLWPPTPC